MGQEFFSEHNLNALDDTIGGRISVAREALGLSAVQLARRLGVKTKTLQDWEADRAEPRANRLVMLAGVLNVSPTWVLVGKGDGPQNELESTEIRLARAEISAVLNTLETMQERLKRALTRLDSAESAYHHLAEEAEQQSDF